MAIVVVFLIFIFGIGLLFKVLKKANNSLKQIILFPIVCLVRPIMLLSEFSDKLLNKINIRYAVSISIALIMSVLTYFWIKEGSYIYYRAGSFHTWKYLLPTLFVLANIGYISEVNNFGKRVGLNKLYLTYEADYYKFLFGGFFAIAVSILIYTPKVNELIEYNSSLLLILSFFYYIVSLYFFTKALTVSSSLAKVYNFIVKNLDEQNYFCIADEVCELYENHTKDLKIFDEQDIIDLVSAAYVNEILEGRYEFIEVEGHQWLFRTATYNQLIKQLDELTNAQLSLSEEELFKCVKKIFNFTDSETKDFCKRYLSFGQFHNLLHEKHTKDYGQVFINYNRQDEFLVCASCGQITAKGEDCTKYYSYESEWFCSETCSKTEMICEEIKETPKQQFINQLTQTGFVLVMVPQAWSDNQKVFAIGGQGHGFAAENANHMIDKLKFKNAKIIGGDNAKNGADRLVNGVEIQTKYCGTAGRSVGAGFDGQNGNYKYIDSNGKPMQLEVPKDQYQQAIKLMEKKIADGKVPGVTDPAEARNIIREGSITYQQARNITKFGTYESLTYDFVEGSIISLVSGGISFTITASLTYYRTGDPKQALEVAIIQGGKVFAKTLTIYVTTQQLHRLPAVVKFVSHIKVENMGDSLGAFITKGLGANNVDQTNKLLRGSFVTSIVLIGVMTGPDLFKMVRGRVSKASFFTNLAVNTSAVTGGVVGSIAGGALGVTFGPMGLWAGKFAGATVGGFVASQLTKNVIGKFVKSDRDLILSLIKQQMELLSIAFLLADYEINSLNDNLEKSLNQKSLELLYASDNRIAAVNMLLKPIVVSIVKQRPEETLDLSDIKILT